MTRLQYFNEVFKVLKISQRALASHLGLHQPVVNRLLRGKQPLKLLHIRAIDSLMRQFCPDEYSEHAEEWRIHLQEAVYFPDGAPGTPVLSKMLEALENFEAIVSKHVNRKQEN